MNWENVDRRKVEVTFWRRWSSTIIGVMVIIIATVTIVLFISVNGLDNEVEQTRERVTVIETGSPCTTSPGTYKCSRAIDGVVSTITIRQALILKRKINKAVRKYKRGEIR